MLISVSEIQNRQGKLNSPIKKLYGSKFINLVKDSSPNTTIIFEGMYGIEERVVSNPYTEVVKEGNHKDFLLPLTNLSKDKISLKVSCIVEVYEEENTTIRYREYNSKVDEVFSVTESMDDIKKLIAKNQGVNLEGYGVLFVNKTFEPDSDIALNTPYDGQGAISSPYYYKSTPIFRARLDEREDFEQDTDMEDGEGGFSRPRASYGNNGSFIVLEDGGYEVWKDEHFHVRKWNKITIEDVGTFNIGDVNHDKYPEVWLEVNGILPNSFSDKKFKLFDVTITDLATIALKEGESAWTLDGYNLEAKENCQFDEYNPKFPNYRLDPEEDVFVAIPVSYAEAMQKGFTDYKALPIKGYEASQRIAWTSPADSTKECYRVG